MSFNIHVDCDPLWIYGDEYGVPVPDRDVSIYEGSLPRFLELFEKYGVRATFFIIGDELALPACVKFAQAALAAGHSIGNHSISHPQDPSALGEGEIRRQIITCHQSFRDTLGYQCRSLRMPGYYFDEEVLKCLGELDYLYDSSVLPGAGIYMMAAFYRLFNRSAKHKRFGRYWYLFAKRSAHALPMRVQGQRCWEVPLGTFPLLGLPIHSTFVFKWGSAYGRVAIQLCQLFRSNCVYLFHAIDLLDDRQSAPIARKVGIFTRSFSQRRRTVENLVKQLVAAGVCLTEESLNAKQ